MPARGYPLDIDVIILFELARGGTLSAPDLLRHAQSRMRANGYKLSCGTWYPAIDRLYRKGYLCWKMDEQRAPTHRIPKLYSLTELGVKEARRLSTVIRNLILSPEASA